jgi:hypothetical protein
MPGEESGATRTKNRLSGFLPGGKILEFVSDGGRGAKRLKSQVIYRDVETLKKASRHSIKKRPPRQTEGSVYGSGGLPQHL